MSFVELAESLGHEVDDSSAKALKRIENKTVAMKYIRRLPKKVAKAAPKKKVATKKVEPKEE
jgi:hypothetical protein|tara:strand:+ start:516 stop:701 length:186 start_codon:yes stop_codon:yes gene_type:complete